MKKFLVGITFAARYDLLAFNPDAVLGDLHPDMLLGYVVESDGKVHAQYGCDLTSDLGSILCTFNSRGDELVVDFVTTNAADQNAGRRS